MASIRRRGRRWQAAIRKGGRRPLYRSFLTKPDAEHWAARVEAAIERGENPAGQDSIGRTVTDMLERFRRSELPKKRDGRNIRRYIDFWCRKLGDRQLSSVSRTDVMKIRDAMATEKSPATVNRYLATLRRAFNLAICEWGWATRNPCERLALEERPGQVRRLRSAEVERLLAATARSEHPQLQTVVLLALTTGARRGEISRIRWQDIDFERYRLTLRDTDGAEDRIVPLVPRLVSALRRLSEGEAGAGRVFSTDDFGGPHGSTLERAWQLARSEAGLSELRFRDLRHSFAGRMATNGATLQEIAAALGHKTLVMAQRYCEPSDHRVRRAMAETGRKVLGEP